MMKRFTSDDMQWFCKTSSLLMEELLWSLSRGKCCLDSFLLKLVEPHAGAKSALMVLLTVFVTVWKW